ncbi:MAG: 4-hydroxy-tetrahydrodipicolinate reductase [Atopobiaceae bacterium]
MAKVVLIGTGRMGAVLEGLIAEREGFELVGKVGFENRDVLPDGLPQADVAIDFSAPALTKDLCTYARSCGCAVVSGTTGLGDEEMGALEELGKSVPVVHSGNYSLGVAVLRRLVAEAARTLSGWDIEIEETHHRKKVDAPSGTAKMLIEACDPEGTCPVVYGREGIAGERPEREIGVHSLRGGTVAGTHEVHFFGTDEELVLTHRAQSRQIFAEGALAAAEKLLGREPGFYTFEDLMFA